MSETPLDTMEAIAKYKSEAKEAIANLKAKKKAEASPTHLKAEQQPRLTNEQIDELWTHLLRCPDFFDDAWPRLTFSFSGSEQDKYNALLMACREVKKTTGLTPRESDFRHVLTDKIKQYPTTLEVASPWVAGGAEDLLASGGLIETAYARAPADLSVPHARHLLKQLLVERTIYDPFCAAVQATPGNCQFQNMPEILEELQKRVRAIQALDTPPLKTLGEEWADHEARLKQFRGKTMIGLRTGLTELDRRTLGLRGVFVFGAKPGVGKTTLMGVEVAIGVCRHHADNDAVVIILSLDMDRFDVYRRHHSRLGEIEWKRLLFGSPENERTSKSVFSKVDQQRLKQAKERLTAYQVDQRLLVVDRTVVGDQLTAAQITGMLAELKAKLGAKRALLIVDYLQLLPVPDDVAERGDTAADKYRIRLIQQAIENTRTADNPMGDTVVLISEARKPPNAKGGWGETMSDIMGSARIPYAGDAVLLYREMTIKEIKKHYGQATDQAASKHRDYLKQQGIVPVMLILEKGRDGMMRGTWSMEFNFHISRFVETISQAAKAAASMSPGFAASAQAPTAPPPLPPAGPLAPPKKTPSNKAAKAAAAKAGPPKVTTASTPASKNGSAVKKKGK